MKKTTFLLNALLCFLLSSTTSITIEAQTLEIYVDEQADIEARIEQALAPLDLSPVTTHILRDRTPRSVHCFPNPYSNSDVER